MLYNLNNPLDYINNMNHGVIPIIGSGKTFKSGTLYSILEHCHKLKARPIAFYKFPNVKKLFPYDDAYTVDDFDDVDINSVLIIEDSARVLPSRSSAHAVSLQEYMGLISHKDILMMLTVQNTASTDLALFRDQDVVRIYKMMSDDAITQERKEFQLDANTANREIKRKSSMLNLNIFYLSYLPRFRSCIFLTPPSWYNFDQSHALRYVKLRQEVQ